MNLRPLIIAGGAAIALAGSAYFALYQAAEKKREKIADHLPNVPLDSNRNHPEFNERARAAHAKLTKGFGVTSALVELSRLYHSNGYYDEAIECYEALIQLDSQNASWPHLLSKINASYGFIDEAIRNGKLSVERDPGYPPAWLDLGNALLKRNEITEAENAFRKALTLDGSLAHARLGLARAYVKRGDWPSAEAELERAVKDSKGRVGVELLATVYEKQGKEGSAKRLLYAHDIGAHVDPSDPWWEDVMRDSYDPFTLSLMSGMAFRRGETEAAFEWLNRANAIDPRDPLILYQLGHAYTSVGNADAAIRTFKRCLAIKPDFSDAWQYLVLAYRDSSDSLAAERALIEGMENCPDSPALLLETAESLHRQGKSQRAIGLLRKSIRLRPNEAKAHVTLARIYFSKGNLNEGIHSMENALQAEPGHPLALTTLAKHAIETKNEPAAREYLESLSLQPKADPNDVGQLEEAFAEVFK